MPIFGVQNLTWIQSLYLDMSGSSLSFPISFALPNSPNFTTLSIHNAIVNFNTGIGIVNQFPNITSLSFVDSILNRTIPTEIGFLKLKKFHVTSNNFSSIPTELGMMNSLQTLQFDSKGKKKKTQKNKRTESN